MRVLLITTGVPGIQQAMPDIGLGYLATRLRKDGHAVSFWDFSIHGHPGRTFGDYLVEHAFDLIGMKVFSSSLPICADILTQIKSIVPTATIILGGPHPSCAPEHTLTYFTQADFACVGEGEECIAALANQLASHDLRPAAIPGLVYRDTKDTARIHANSAAPGEDLDALGIPAWDLMPPRGYMHKQSLHALPKGRVVAPISVSRGCPFGCSFCTAHTIMGHRTRYRSVTNVLDEIQILVNEYGVDELHIVDDFFAANRDYVLEFCQGLSDRGLRVPWACPFGIRVDSISADLVRTMYEAGCYMVSLGIESGTQRILDLMNKRLDLSIVRDKINIIRRNSGIVIQGFFILGYPTETREDIMRTIDFACSLPIHMAGFTTLRLTPGANVLDLARQEGWMDFAWECTNVEQVSYHPKDISADELRRLRRYAYLRFFLHPKRVLFLLGQCSSLRNGGIFLRLAYRRLRPKRTGASSSSAW